MFFYYAMIGFNKQRVMIDRPEKIPGFVLIDIEQYDDWRRMKIYLNRYSVILDQIFFSKIRYVYLFNCNVISTTSDTQ